MEQAERLEFPHNKHYDLNDCAGHRSAPSKCHLQPALSGHPTNRQLAALPLLRAGLSRLGQPPSQLFHRRERVLVDAVSEEPGLYFCLPDCIRGDMGATRDAIHSQQGTLVSNPQVIF